MNLKSISTWALHSAIGTVAPGRPGSATDRLMQPAPGTMDLLDVPQAIADHGFEAMELCHFHIPDRSAAYLGELRGRIDSAGIKLWSTLIDDGDITDANNADRDIEWITSWVETAAALGSKCVRVIGGKQPDSPLVRERSIRGLRRIVEHAQIKRVRVLTENWFPTLSSPDAVCTVLDRLEGDVGLCFDFGNWTGDTKYKDLDRIADYAEGSHAKYESDEDFLKCLEILRDVEYEGPYTLVWADPDDLWGSLARQLELIES